jgi:hypothetical protein
LRSQPPLEGSFISYVSPLTWVEPYGGPILSVVLYGIGRVTVVIGVATVTVVPVGTVTVAVVSGVLTVTVAGNVGRDRVGRGTVGTPNFGGNSDRATTAAVEGWTDAGAAAPPAP